MRSWVSRRWVLACGRRGFRMRILLFEAIYGEYDTRHNSGLGIESGRNGVHEKKIMTEV